MQPSSEVDLPGERGAQPPARSQAHEAALGAEPLAGDPLAPVARGACLNCGAPLAGAFCRACGQRDIPPYPSMRELVVDAFSEFSGWDGRFIGTLRALFRHPGLLTREFLEGRRVRYISPVRLYLMASLTYFVLAAAAPDGRSAFRMRSDNPGVAGATDAPPASRPERVAGAAGKSMDSGSLTSAEMEAALKDLESAPPVLQPLLRRAIQDPDGLRVGILRSLPRLLWVLLPVLAGIIALFYRGRKYPEHLYFAIHLNAFIFLALAGTELLKLTHSPVITIVAALVALISIPVYATLAFRRVYGGSVIVTVMKEIGIAAIYAVTSVAAFIAMIYWVSIAG